MALSRLQQISIAQESTEATATSFASLFTAANSKYLVIDPSLDFSVNVYERNIKKSSLTRLQSLTGTKTGTVRFSMELTGDTSATGVPAWGLPLRACGFRQEKLTKLSIGTITGGPFKHGEIVTQTTSGAKGMVVGDTYDGENTLWVAQENHLGFDPGATTVTAFTITAGHTLTGATSGATCAEPTGVAGTLSGVTYNAPAGVAWFPWSYPLSVIRTDTAGLLVAATAGSVFYGATSGAVGQFFYADSSGPAAATLIYYRRISGSFQNSEAIWTGPAGTGTKYADLGAAGGAAQFQIPSLTLGMSKDAVRESIKASRGTVSFSGRIGEPMIMSFEFQGGLNENSGASSQDAGNVTGVTYSAQIPPVLLDADLTHGKSGTSLLNMYGPCISQIDIAMANEIGFRECMADAAGIQETVLTARTPTISIDPELVTEGTWDFLEQFTDNTPSRATFVVGSALQNKFTFKMPGVSWTSVTTGDRNGIATRQLQGVLHGGSQSSTSTAEDNELVLIYQIL